MISVFPSASSWKPSREKQLRIIRPIRLRAAVERHFETIGDYPRIIAFRNILIHGYDLVDDAEVGKVICEHLPVLAKQVEALLRHAENR